MVKRFYTDSYSELLQPIIFNPGVSDSMCGNGGPAIIFAMV